jgi:superfamily II RNA helicase
MRGLLPVFKEIVERLFNTGLIKLLFATETFALGVNMPARCVAFQSLRKFDGVSFDYMKTRDYFQMAGRAGRQGIDEVGDVFSLLDPRDLDLESIGRILYGQTEPVKSRFNLDYSAVLCLYERLGERVPQAYEKSFAHFVRRRSAAPKDPSARNGKRRRRKSKPRESRLIGHRLRVLKRLGYIEDGALTAKGTFASRINGYEVQAAELLHYGLFHLADEYQLCVLMVAMVFEERRGDMSSRLDDAILQEIKPPLGEEDRRVPPIRVRVRDRRAHAGRELSDVGPHLRLGARRLVRGAAAADEHLRRGSGAELPDGHPGAPERAARAHRRAGPEEEVRPGGRDAEPRRGRREASARAGVGRRPRPTLEWMT